MKTILTTILSILGAIGTAFYLGGKNQKNKENEKILDKAKATKKRRNKRANDTAADDLKWLLEHNND